MGDPQSKFLDMDKSDNVFDAFEEGQDDGLKQLRIESLNKKKVDLDINVTLK